MISSLFRMKAGVLVCLIALLLPSSALWAQDGSLDASFNPGSGANATVWATKVQPDGKVLVGGDFTQFNGSTVNRIIRLNADGSVDNTFQSGTGANSIVRAIAVRPNGKIIIAGGFTSYNGTPVNRIAQLNADGSLDATYFVGTGFNAPVWTVELAPDGALFVGGQFSSYDGGGGANLVKLTEAGFIATDFSVGTGTNNVVYDIKLLDDGKVLIGGAFSSYNGTSISRIARLGASGFLDGSFNPGSGPNGFIRSIDVQSDGKILIAGAFNSVNNEARTRIARLNENGSLDPAFVLPATTTQIPNVFGIRQQGDGKVLFYGSFAGSIARTNPDGSFDTSFQPNVDNVVYTMDVQSDGKLVVGGFFQFIDLVNRNYIGRLNNTAGSPPVLCEAGTLISPDPATLCPTDIYTYDVSGAEVPDGYQYALFYQPGPGATGALGNPFYITIGTPPPYAFNSDINGVLSFNNLPPLQGPWFVQGVVYSDPNDITGSICSSTAITALLTFNPEGTPECPVIACDAGSITSTDDLAVCPGEFYSFEVSGQSVPLGATYAVLFEPGPTGTGALGGGFYINATSLPYVFDADVNGILSFNALPPLQGEWTVTGVIYTDVNDIENTVCSSTATSVTLNFLDASAPACQPAVPGCTDSNACNFDVNATEDNGSCVYAQPFLDCAGACLNDTDGDGVCNELELPGCQDSNACNYNAAATDDDGSCVYAQPFLDCAGACLNDTDGDGVCNELEVPGCQDSNACNFNATATDDDGSCIYAQPFLDCAGACLNDIDGDGVCDELEVPGCQVSNACNFNATATDDDGSCVYAQPFLDCAGVCLNDTDGDGVCNELEVPGCQDSNACNFNAAATDEDGSCVYAQPFFDCDGVCINDIDGDGVCDELELEGCTYPLALNYNSYVATDDGSCVFGGCTNPSALNYTPLATADDGSCDFGSAGACPSDINNDGIVNSTDLSLFLGDFGTLCN